MRLRDLLAILALAILWYALVPVVGAFAVRRLWREMRRRFNALRVVPVLNYATAQGLDEYGSDFRFFGGFESVVDDKVLWVRNAGLTIPVELSGARVYLLPAAGPVESGDATGKESAGPDEEPRQIRWKQVASLSEGAKVFVGGRALKRNGRACFESLPEEPLLIILYDGNERSMLSRTVRAGRKKNEYWNALTPYSLAAGIFSELVIAFGFASRPAFGAALSIALAAAFGPLLPLLPPGLGFTAVFRSLWRRGRAARATRDLVRLPLCHLRGNQKETVLPDGSRYGYLPMNGERRRTDASHVPIVPAEAETLTSSGSGKLEWRCYGVLAGMGEATTVSEPQDPSAAFAAIPGDPELVAREYIVQARLFEISAIAALLTGICLNAALAYYLISYLR